MTNSTWTVAGTPYTLSGSLIKVINGVTLTVEPGVIIQSGVIEFRVEGTLNAIGTPTMPITFTQMPATEGALNFQSGGTGNLQHIIYEMKYGLWVREGSGLVQISDSVIRDSVSMGVDADASAIHQLQMNNVTFVNNTFNRVFIEIGESSSPIELIDDVVLSPQNNLEAYQIGTSNGHNVVFDIPAGITLTLEPGVTLIREEAGVHVFGHLEAIGTPTMPIILTALPTIWPGCLYLLERWKRRYATCKL